MPIRVRAYVCMCSHACVGVHMRDVVNEYNTSGSYLLPRLTFPGPPHFPHDFMSSSSPFNI